MCQRHEKNRRFFEAGLVHMCCVCEVMLHVLLLIQQSAMLSMCVITVYIDEIFSTLVSRPKTKEDKLDIPQGVMVWDM